MSTDINQDTDDSFESNTHYGVFRDGLRVRQPLKDADTRLCVLPAHDSPKDPESWVPYRNSAGKLDDNGDFPFTTWMIRYFAFQFIGPKGNQGHFLAEGLTDSIPDFPDPVAKLVDTARKDRDYDVITGLGPDGKKSKDPEAFQFVQLSPAEELFAANGVCLNPSKEEDAGVGCLYSLRKTMVKGKWDVKETGLLAALRLHNRRTDGIEPADFANYYYWGDITDIAAMVPCLIEKVQVEAKKGKGKSFPYYNMAPDRNAQPVRGSKSMLRDRALLSDCLNRGVEPSETLERLVGMFSDYPKLIRKAFETSYPGVANMLEETEVVSKSRVHQPGKDRELEPAAVTKQAPAAKNQEDDLPPPASGRTFAPRIVQSEESPNATPAKRVGNKEAINAEAARIRRELQGDEDEEQKAAA